MEIYSTPAYTFQVKDKDLEGLVSRCPEVDHWLAELVQEFGKEQTVYLRPPLSKSAEEISTNWSEVYTSLDGKSDLLSLYKEQTKETWKELIQLRQELESTTSRGHRLWIPGTIDEARSLFAHAKNLVPRIHSLEETLLCATQQAVDLKADSLSMGLGGVGTLETLETRPPEDEAPDAARSSSRRRPDSNGASDRSKRRRREGPSVRTPARESAGRAEPPQDIGHLICEEVDDTELKQLVTRCPEVYDWLPELMEESAMERADSSLPPRLGGSILGISARWSEVCTFGDGTTDLLSFYKEHTKETWKELIRLSKEEEAAVNNIQRLWDLGAIDEANALVVHLEKLRSQIRPLEESLVRATKGAKSVLAASLSMEREAIMALEALEARRPRGPATDAPETPPSRRPAEKQFEDADYRIPRELKEQVEQLSKERLAYEETLKRKRPTKPQRFLKRVLEDPSSIPSKTEVRDVPLPKLSDGTAQKGVFATEVIPPGEDLGAYLGELKLAAHCEDSKYSFDLPAAWSEEIYVDATTCGNWTRFVNHGDNPPKAGRRGKKAGTANVRAVRVYHKGIPYNVFRTTREIKEGEQILIDYGPSYKWEGDKQEL